MRIAAENAVQDQPDSVQSFRIRVMKRPSNNSIRRLSRICSTKDRLFRWTVRTTRGGGYRCGLWANLVGQVMDRNGAAVNAT